MDYYTRNIKFWIKSFIKGYYLKKEEFGGDIGEEKTRERIKLSFVWPKMRRELDKFCKSCEKCQLKARSLVMDRVPITPIPREDVAFKRMTMDAVGPIEPTSAAGHKYCLCICGFMYEMASSIPTEVFNR